MIGTIEKQIALGAQAAQKHYDYAQQHDPTLPAEYWFQESQEGLILFVVFYTQACRWNRCLGCNLPSKMSMTHVGYKDLIQQIDALFACPEIAAQAGRIEKLIVSNNGSVLDEVTFSSTALMYLLTRVNLNLPKLRSLNLETRPEYVDVAELEFISRALQEGESATQLELAIGFEAFDETIRNEHFQKGLKLEVFEGFVRKIAPYGFHLKCYFMQKPVPGMSDEQAVEDIQKAIRYLEKVVTDHTITLNIHLNPTYAAYGTQLETALHDGTFVPPTLVDVARAALAAKDSPLTLFIGLFDENLAAEGGSFIRPGDEKTVELIEKFNRTQDFSCLSQVVETAPDGPLAPSC